MEYVYELHMTAYGDENLAQRAKSRAAEAYADKMIAERRKAG